MQRIAGLIEVKVDGEIKAARGNWTYGLGRPKATTIVGADGVHGYKEEPQVAFIEGEITDAGDLDLAALVGTRAATVTIQLGNGKMVVLRDAIYAGEGVGNSEEANVDARFEGAGAEEIT